VFVFSKVPLVGFIVNSDEKFSIVHSSFSISEWFSFVLVCFYSFVEELGQYQVPIRCAGGFIFLMVQEKVVISKFEYGWEGRWGNTSEVMSEMVYFLHQGWFVPVRDLIIESSGSVCGGNVFLVCFVE
jgi:hypothetical protein